MILPRIAPLGRSEDPRRADIEIDRSEGVDTVLFVEGIGMILRDWFII